MARVTINVPAQDRRRKNSTIEGKTMLHPIGNKIVRFVIQDNGHVSHYATGGIALHANTIKARMLSNYVHNPYADLPRERQVINTLLDEIDPERFFAAVAKVPVINL